jgi:hypothetical protein
MKPIALVINLDRRPERWARCQELWSPHFELVRVSAVDNRDNPALGCKQSHIHVAVTYASERMAIVLEDDAVPTPEFNQYGMKYIREAEAFTDEWNFCNGGPFLDLRGAKGSDYDGLFSTLSQTQSPLWLKASFALQTHFMLYTHRSWEVLMQSVYSALPLDVFIGTWAQRYATRMSTLWVPTNLLAAQAVGPSDIGGSPQNQEYWYGRSTQLLQVSSTYNKQQSGI